MAAGFGRPAAAGQRLGNTCLEASRGRELPKPTSRTVVKHPLPIPPSRRWFALDTLCKVVVFLTDRSDVSSFIYVNQVWSSKPHSSSFHDVEALHSPG